MFKRAQLAALGTVVVLVLVLLNLPAQTAARIKLAVGGLFLPLFGIVSAGQSFLDRASYQFVPRSALITEIERLRHENEQLRLTAAQGTDALTENNRIRAALGHAPRGPWKLHLARVVGREPTTWWRTVQLAYGSRDGARVNQPVVTSEGLIGRISAVGFTHSQVALLGDADCGVAVLVNETRDNGVIRGPQSTTEAGLVEMTSLQSSPQMMAGHLVVTSGLGGVFPKGIVVGRIVDTRPVDNGLYTSARVRLAANLNRLEEVWVLEP